MNGILPSSRKTSSRLTPAVLLFIFKAPALPNLQCDIAVKLQEDWGTTAVFIPAKEPIRARRNEFFWILSYFVLTDGVFWLKTKGSAWHKVGDYPEPSNGYFIATWYTGATIMLSTQVHRAGMTRSVFPFLNAVLAMCSGCTVLWLSQFYRLRH